MRFTCLINGYKMMEKKSPFLIELNYRLLPDWSRQLACFLIYSQTRYQYLSDSELFVKYQASNIWERATCLWHCLTF